MRVDGDDAGEFGNDSAKMEDGIDDGDSGGCVLRKVVWDEKGASEQSSAIGVPSTTSESGETCVGVAFFARFDLRSVEREESERLADFGGSSSFTLVFPTCLEFLDERAIFPLRRSVMVSFFVEVTTSSW